MRRNSILAYWASGNFAGVLLLGGPLWAVVPALGLVWLGHRLYDAEMANARRQTDRRSS